MNANRWDERAACSGVELEVFYPDHGTGGGAARAYEWAKQWCRVCPVRRDCLEEAMAAEGAASGKNRYGLVGGLDPNERAALYERRRPKPINTGEACGTYAGWHRHRTAGEPTCGPCKAAVAERKADERQAKRQQALAA